VRLARLFFSAAIAIAVAAPLAATAQTVMPVDKFTSVELHGGGTITIRQGPVQRVTMVSGDPGGSHHLDVEIETPVLNGVGIHGGGHITAHGAFPAQSAVSAVIHGGGDIDMKDVPAQSASAAIHGGGKISVAAQNNLSAEIYGGGAIRYIGQPAVNSTIHGGGTVAPIH
jgi:hypothetical protein